MASNILESIAMASMTLTMISGCFLDSASDVPVITTTVLLVISIALVTFLDLDDDEDDEEESDHDLQGLR